ncbi:hypothetical protein [Chlamydia felis Fe/C-56]|uniref:Uncharacterized protein n=1 Tax=Chlamydia felis (strain Fe/C-56) TaxID=264202 RepID=Q253I0_CHLFF|nr:hypothetical protein [Chlamydia felis Fe/C-56]
MNTSEEESKFTAFLARSKERFFQQKKFLKDNDLRKAKSLITLTRERINFCQIQLENEFKR